MSKRALVTGGNGFVGRYLCELLRREGAQVTAVSQDVLAPVPDGVELAPADIRERNAIQAVVKRVQPDEIYHLAAISSVSQSFADPAQTFAINVGGTYNVLEAASLLDRQVRVLNVSTSQVYAPREGAPIEESWPIRPASPYALSKAMAELAMWPFAERGIEVVVARAFNHSGPGQSAHFVLPSLARQFAMFASGRAQPILRTGSLEVSRDFLDVRDVVQAYVLLARRGSPSEAYNVCSGEARCLSAVVDLLEEISGITVTRTIDPALARVEARCVLGSNSKLTRDTSWVRAIDFATTIGNMFDLFVEEISKSVAPVSM